MNLLDPRPANATDPTRATRSTAPAPRGFWPMRDLPTAFWLVATVIAVVAHRDLPMPRWLMIHLLLLGAITHAILVWSQYFSFALMRSRASLKDRRDQNIRLMLSNGGAALVFIGVPTNIWALTVAGAVSLVVAVAWHGASIYMRLRKSLAGKFGHTTKYYIAASGLLIIGVVLGALLAREGSAGLVLAHTLINVLGWVGLTVAGTIVTLWPTILRTRADEHAPLGAARALPALAFGVLVAATGAAFSLLLLLAIGLLLYLTGLGIIGYSLWRAARQATPHSFAALSVGFALIWWIGIVALLFSSAVVSLIESSDFRQVSVLIRAVVPYLAAGFAAQVLVGALSYLIPVVLGGGPSAVRVGTAVFDRAGPFRIAVTNSALAVCALPVSSLIRVAASVLYLIAMSSFLVIMFMAMRAQRRAKAGQAFAGQTVTSRASVSGVGSASAIRASDGGASGESAGAGSATAGDAAGTRSTGNTTDTGGTTSTGTGGASNTGAGQAVAGLLVVLLTVAGFAAADPIGLGWGAAATGSPNAPVQTVRVEAADMRFSPDRIEVPVGTRLVIELVNTDTEHTHDLVFANGVAGTRLTPGGSETIDVGVITESLEGWCSIVGHRQLGMTLEVVAIDGSGAPVAAQGEHAAAQNDHSGNSNNAGSGRDHAAHASASTIDLMADPGSKFKPYDAVLPPLPERSEPVTHALTLTATDTLQEVAPGVTQTHWTFGDTAPGPVLHGRVGDTFEVTLVNDGSIGHSIDFHAGALAPDEPMRTIAPGEQLTYTFTATRAGIWMYHCSTMPMSAHIANGMYGAVVIEPQDLPSVDRSYVMVQGEYYLGDHDGGEVDVDKIATRNPDLVVFNGYANQYDHVPLEARVGERVRVWVLDAGIERPSSFHIVGGQFNTVWKEGQYLINRVTDTGSQALGLLPAQGGFVELTFPEAGHYPFVSHLMLDAERGAHGIFRVTENVG